MYRWELWNAMNVLTNGIFFFMLKFVKIYTKLNEMALHDMTSGDFTHDTQNTYTHNKHRVRMRPPKGVWQVTWQVSDNLGVSCDDPI